MKGAIDASVLGRSMSVRRSRNFGIRVGIWGPAANHPTPVEEDRGLGDTEKDTRSSDARYH